MFNAWQETSLNVLALLFSPLTKSKTLEALPHCLPAPVILIVSVFYKLQVISNLMSPEADIPQFSWSSFFRAAGFSIFSESWATIFTSPPLGWTEMSTYPNISYSALHVNWRKPMHRFVFHMHLILCSWSISFQGHFWLLAQTLLKLLGYKWIILNQDFPGSSEKVSYFLPLSKNCSFSFLIKILFSLSSL